MGNWLATLLNSPWCSSCLLEGGAGVTYSITSHSIPVLLLAFTACNCLLDCFLVRAVSLKVLCFEKVAKGFDFR